jgi:hypothetical protein
MPLAHFTSIHNITHMPEVLVNLQCVVAGAAIVQVVTSVDNLPVYSSTPHAHQSYKAYAV